MTESSGRTRDYFPIDSFALDRDFHVNPLMSVIKLARYKFVAKMLSKDDVVLDIGCGRGYSSHFFAQTTKQVIGVDLYSDIPVVSKMFNADNLKFIQADILDPPPEITDAPITAVTAIDVIEHFQREDGVNIVDRYADLLSDGGMMVLGSPSKFSQAYRSNQSQDVHFYEYEPEELRELCDLRFRRTLLFSMNDELVHTGFNKLAWFFFVLAFK